MTEPSSTDRKICPHCGHSNRATANICTQCGRSFILVRATGTLRKKCNKCGYENRLKARVCSQCGQPFKIEKAVNRPMAGAKWCPKCGKARKAGAKVCSQCGYRFHPSQTGSAPIIQTAQPAITLAPNNPPPVNLPPDLKGEPAPYLSSEEIDRLRHGGVYHSNVFVRLMYQMTKKDAP